MLSIVVLFDNWRFSFPSFTYFSLQVERSLDTAALFPREMYLSQVGRKIIYRFQDSSTWSYFIDPPVERFPLSPSPLYLLYLSVGPQPSKYGRTVPRAEAGFTQEALWDLLEAGSSSFHILLARTTLCSHCPHALSQA